MYPIKKPKRIRPVEFSLFEILDPEKSEEIQKLIEELSPQQLEVLMRIAANTDRDIKVVVVKIAEDMEISHQRVFEVIGMIRKKSLKLGIYPTVADSKTKYEPLVPKIEPEEAPVRRIRV